MNTTAELVWAMFFGAVGLGYFTYGRKQRAVVPLVCGVSLFIFPYFMPNVYVLVVTGIVIMVVPYFIR
jgi:multisubunit Na+/H+ antiporter MnhC subunit